MPLNAAQLVELRPYLYHLTSNENAGRIADSKRLVCAEGLALEYSGSISALSKKRCEHLRLSCEERGSVLIRDQAPLYEGNVAFEPSWQMSELLRLLNSRVFFWPGNERGPIASGLNHFKRYAVEGPVIIRCPTASLLDANESLPELCRYNSGAPRCSGGKKSPRGASTFQTLGDFDGTASKVIEVTFVSSAVLPDDSEVATCPHGPWVPFN